MSDFLESLVKDDTVSIDRNFLASLLLEGNFLTALEGGVQLDHMEGEAEIKVWKFVESYFNQYRSTPSLKLIEDEFGTLPRPVEPLQYWMSEIQKRKLKDEMNELSLTVEKKLQERDPEAAYSELREFVKNREQNLVTKSSVISILDLKDSVWQMYQDAKAGKMGIPTPWHTLNDWTRGWFPKDMSYVIARSSIGKTWFSIFLAEAAVRSKYNTLFISCEMSKEDIASRFYSYTTKKAYAAIRRGRLAPLEERDFQEALTAYKPGSPFDLRDGSQGLSIIDIERQIEKSNAKLVLVDSSYRIRARQKTSNRFENMAYVADDLKLFAQMYGKAIVATTQVNREGGKKGKDEGMGQEDVALSDMINWNSTNILGLQRGKEDENKNKLNIYPIKVRENENTEKPMQVNWNFHYMDFSEFGREGVTEELPSDFPY